MKYKNLLLLIVTMITMTSVCLSLTSHAVIPNHSDWRNVFRFIGPVDLLLASQKIPVNIVSVAANRDKEPIPLAGWPMLQNLVVLATMKSLWKEFSFIFTLRLGFGLPLFFLAIFSGKLSYLPRFGWGVDDVDP